MRIAFGPSGSGSTLAPSIVHCTSLEPCNGIRSRHSSSPLTAATSSLSSNSTDSADSATISACSDVTTAAGKVNRSAAIFFRHFSRTVVRTYATSLSGSGVSGNRTSGKVSVGCQTLPGTTDACELAACCPTERCAVMSHRNRAAVDRRNVILLNDRNHCQRVTVMMVRPMISPQNIPLRIASVIEIVIVKLIPSRPNATSENTRRYSSTAFRRTMLSATSSIAMPASIARRRRNCVTWTAIGSSECTVSMSVRCCQPSVVASCQCEIKFRISAGTFAPGISCEFPSRDSDAVISRSRMCNTSVGSEAAKLVAAARSSS